MPRGTISKIIRISIFPFFISISSYIAFSTVSYTRDNNLLQFGFFLKKKSLLYLVNMALIFKTELLISSIRSLNNDVNMNMN